MICKQKKNMQYNATSPYATLPSPPRPFGPFPSFKGARQPLQITLSVRLNNMSWRVVASGHVRLFPMSTDLFELHNVPL